MSNTNFTLHSDHFATFRVSRTIFGDNIIVFSANNRDQFLKISKKISYDRVNEKNIMFYVKNEEDTPTLTTFKNTITSIISTKSVLKKKLDLTGLGYRVAVSDVLDFKLGYSHPVSLALPKSIKKFSLIKKKVAIESLDKIQLGNFAYKIYSLKKYDCYKGKGFSFFNTTKRLKEIKKK